MKDQETRQEFIRLRAEGKSFRYIAEALHIGRATCSAWEKELKQEVDASKQERLEELYDNFAMTKAARVKRLGSTLNRIKDALEEADLAAMPPEKLLDFYLKYAAALKEEYTPAPVTPPAKSTESELYIILGSLQALLEKVKAGEVTAEQAAKEQAVINSLLKAYEAVELKKKIDMLESIVGSK